MFAVHFGMFCMVLLCCCKRSQGSLVVKNRTGVALAGETLQFQITVTVPVNSTGKTVYCYRNEVEVWKHNLKDFGPTEEKLQFDITMNNSLDSGVYSVQFLDQKYEFVVLVRDKGYIMPPENAPTRHATAMLVVTLLLLLFSITGSIYIFKWHKDHPQSEENGDGEKDRKIESKAGVATQDPNSESVYTSLEPRAVSIYDVLTVDQARRESKEKRTSQHMANTTQTEEGIFESVYENF